MNSKQKTERTGSVAGSLALNVVTWAATIILTIPAFIAVFHYVPEIKFVVANNYTVYLHPFLTLALVSFIIYRLMRLMRNVVAIAAVALVLFLAINLIRHKYSFHDIYHDYRSMIVYLQEKPIKVPFLPEAASFRNANLILKAIDFNNHDVRNYAVTAGIAHFNDARLYGKYGNAVRYFSVFKEVKPHWQYVQDPNAEEYYAPASETIKHLAGDCDDYSILMAALIKSIGGRVRLVRTIGHLYPEVLVCNRNEFHYINLIVRDLFEKESDGKSIFYHEDADGNVWLNFDYTENYPGGPFLNEKILGILNV